MCHLRCMLRGYTTASKHCSCFQKQTNTSHTVLVTYLIDESLNVGKGANSIITVFANHGLGETSVHLHADNCCGQNKNRYLMGYLMWRVLTGLHREIKISFLPVGHTKFASDWCFGLDLQSRPFAAQRLAVWMTLPM